MKSGFAAAIFDMDGVPFDERSDYRAYVDGKPRREGCAASAFAQGGRPSARMRD